MKKCGSDMKFRLACAAGIVAAVAMAEVVLAKGLVDYPGVVDEKSGWRCVASEAGKTVYVPFEGYYESKGGRIESPKFELDKAPEENAWYEFSFQAKSSVEGFWWVDVFDAKGAPLPDMNSRLYVSDDWRPYKVVVSMQCGTKQAQLAFVTTKGVSVRDVSFRRISVKAAADWCRELYRTLPQVDLSVPADAWDRLPRAKKLLTEGKPIRILLLGDSNVNDTWCGNVAALICEKFPNARLNLSVRGSTGCWYYREPEHFAEYVLRYKPDLLLFGGAASGRFDADFSRAEEDLTAVVDLARKNGIEICIMSPAPSYEFRKTPEDASWDENFVHARYEDWAKKVVHIQPMRRDFQRKVVAKRGVAYFDLTTATCDAILRSRKPLDWFKRDIAHNDDRGKQLIAQRLAAYFNVLGSRKTDDQ